MNELSKRPTFINDRTKHDLKVIFSISLGLFLFILFFQPFELNSLSFNNKLLFLTGLGAITFAIIVLFQIVLPQVWPKFFKTGFRESEPVYLIHALIWIFLSTAFAFYVRYVGSIKLSMYLVFKIVIMCFSAVVVMRLYYNSQSLRHRILQLHENLTNVHSQLAKYEKEPPALNVELFSDNKSEKIVLQSTDLVMIRSADNYIEIVYKENDQFKKKLIRNTLRNIEDMLGYYPEFIRCHRTCIVNKNYIEKLNRNYTGQKIILKGYDAEIPVSRQYQLLVKEALSNG
jgi:DNA-binding LytR/AlgR family response regulator